MRLQKQNHNRRFQYMSTLEKRKLFEIKKERRKKEVKKKQGKRKNKVERRKI